ncbi:MAG: 4-alpha-glucanotransferase [archaeon]
MGLEQVLNFQQGDKGTALIWHITSFHDPISPNRFVQGLSATKDAVGVLGSGAFEVIDFLADTGSSVMQINPIGHTGYGNSPYQTFSLFAGNPYMISLEGLYKAGDISKELHDTYCANVPNWQADSDFEWLFKNKIGGDWNSQALLRIAYNNFLENKGARRASFDEWCTKQGKWLTDYAEFMAIKELHGHNGSWNQWSPGARANKFGDFDFRDNKKWKKNKKRLKKEFDSDYQELEKTIEFYKYLQFVFFGQWDEFREYANSKGIKISGDRPWYPGWDSADVWANKSAFKIDRNYNPIYVAGVPPDYFEPKNGQLWGNPVYNWNSKSAYELVTSSFAHLLKHVDIVRVDHARAIDTYWEIPFSWAKKQNTGRKGRWSKGPGDAFFQALSQKLEQENIIKKGKQLPLILEDLGLLDPLFPTKKSYPNGNIPDTNRPYIRYSVSRSFRKLICAKNQTLIDGLTDNGGYEPRNGLNALMQKWSLPFMAVEHFKGDPRLAHENVPYDCVDFIATHDNKTTYGLAREIGDDPDSLCNQYLYDVLSSKAILSGGTWQDLFHLDRPFNMPGNMTNPKGWWTARLTRDEFKELGPSVGSYLKQLNQGTGRYHNN